MRWLMITASVAVECACAKKPPRTEEDASIRAADAELQRWASEARRRPAEKPITETAPRRYSRWKYVESVTNDWTRCKDVKDGAACLAVAERFEGHAPDVSPTIAIDGFRMGCAYGNADACVKLGERYEHLDDRAATWPTDQYPHDLARAAVLFERACTISKVVGCIAYARAILKGYAETPNPQKATNLLTKLCETADAPAYGQACYEVAPLKTGDSSRYYLSRACQLGVTAACDRLREPRSGD